MKKSLWTGAAAAALAIPAATYAQRAGDWVLGQWQGGSDWYPGVVERHVGGQVTIRYDDGTRETRPANQVRRYDWRVGSQVVCRYTDGQWYDATITQMYADGLTISVRYNEDGVRQRTNTGRCRSE